MAKTPDNDEAPSPPWVQASLQDLSECDLEVPISNATCVDWHTFGDAYHAAAKAETTQGPGFRVYTLLAHLLWMMFHPENPAAPFTPILVWANGRRSAELHDFRPVVDVVAALAERCTHPTLVSRCADVAWSLERRRHDAGLAAFNAYLTLLDGVEAGAYHLAHEAELDAGDLGVSVLRRCLTIARSRSLGERAPSTAPLRVRIEAQRCKAGQTGAVARHLRYARLLLAFHLANAAAMAKEIEASAEILDQSKDGPFIADVLKASVSAYYSADQAQEAYRVQRRISDLYIALAERVAGNAMMASGYLADAISALAGVPGLKDERRALRHRLIDAQAGIGEEMVGFSEKLDLDEARAAVGKAVADLDFYELLFFFAVMCSTPNPAKVRADAIESIRKHPLSSLFAATFHDHEGKVVHAVKGADMGDTGAEASIAVTIAQHEGLRRQLDVGLLDVALREIASRFYIAPDILAPILVHSPFVPEGRLQAFSRGLTAFLRGDTLAAVYILVPLVEAGVRGCLKDSGYEVTTFDDTRRTQEDKGLSALFRDQRANLEEVFGPRLTFAIDQLFLAAPGPQIRHAVAHGLFHDGTTYSADAFYACWLVLHLCLGPLYGVRQELHLPSLSS